MITLGISSLLIAYLIGSLASAVWIGKWMYGVDVRKHGSGNAGATNVFRVLGKKAGIPVLIFDAFKGWLAVMIPVWLLGGFESPVLFENFRVLCGALAVWAMYSLYLQISRVERAWLPFWAWRLGCSYCRTLWINPFLIRSA